MALPIPTPVWKAIRRDGWRIFHLAGPASRGACPSLCGGVGMLLLYSEALAWTENGTVPGMELVDALEVPEGRQCPTCWHIAWPMN